MKTHSFVGCTLYFANTYFCWAVSLVYVSCTANAFRLKIHQGEKPNRLTFGVHRFIKTSIIKTFRYLARFSWKSVNVIKIFDLRRKRYKELCHRFALSYLQNCYVTLNVATVAESESIIQIDVFKKSLLRSSYNYAHKNIHYKIYRLTAVLRGLRSQSQKTSWGVNKKTTLLLSNIVNSSIVIKYCLRKRQTST